jgi:flagellar assembly factor FliW
MQGLIQEKDLVEGKQSVPAMDTTSDEQETGRRTVHTRFGKVSLQLDKAIEFSKGMLGMPDKKKFCLTEFPNERFSQFKLMQSLEDNELAFITFPIDVSNPYIEAKDIEEACATLEISMGALAMLLVVTVHRRVDGISLSANARAPLLIDTAKQTAVQYVLPNNAYDIRHPLNDVVQGNQ